MFPTTKGGRDWAAFYLNLSRTGGDVVAYRLAGRPAFLVNSPAHAARVLEGHASNYRSPAHPYAELAGLYADEGSALLRLGRAGVETQDAHRSAARTLAEAGARAALLFCELSEGGGFVDVEFELKRLMFAEVARLLFGVDASHLAADFVRAVALAEEFWADGLNQSSGEETDPAGQSFRDALARQDETAAWVARSAGADGAEVSPETRGAVSRTLLNGYHATAAALCWTLHLLARHPSTLAALHEECDRGAGSESGSPPLLRAVLSESLRLYPPAWILSREALGSDRLGGTEIPAGASVSVSPYAMHRHPRLWERPSEFLPGRFLKGRPAEPFAYLPFGAGARRCPAGNVAVRHLQVLLVALLQRCRVEPLDDEPVRPRGLVSLRPHPHVRLRFRRR
ncbi:MAG TPA: cytochrome P450 [Pyrinomonadaceae bacterium]|nr:cytochrome P450 [Pyrinomonadaceae bacterium]